MSTPRLTPRAPPSSLSALTSRAAPSCDTAAATSCESASYAALASRTNLTPSELREWAAAGAALGVKLAGIGDVLSLDANGTAGTGSIG